MRSFSVIIPVYNVESYLTDCLDSVCRSFESARDVSLEVLCVDDGSTDGSSGLLDAYAARQSAFFSLHPTFTLKVIHQANAGVSAARNRAMAVASGEWLLFLDSDDFVRDSWLSDIDALIAARPSADLVGFGMLPFYGTLDWGEDDCSPRDLRIDREIPDELVGMSVYRFGYRRSVFGDLRFRPYVVGEDLVFTCEAFARSRLCAVIGKREYGYRCWLGSVTHSDFPASRMKIVPAFNVDMFRVLAASGKRIGKMFSTGRGNEWIEAVPKMILAELPREGWFEVWDVWLDSMGEAAKVPFFSGWQRFAARVVFMTRSRFVVCLVCLLPRWLKRKGFVKS